MANLHSDFINQLLLTREELAQEYPTPLINTPEDTDTQPALSIDGVINIRREMERPQRAINNITDNNLYRRPQPRYADAVDAMRYAGTATGRIRHNRPRDTWINNLAQNVDRTQREARRLELLPLIHIDYDRLEQRYHAQLGDDHITHNAQHYYDRDNNDTAIRQLLIDRLINNHMEQNPMALAMYDTGTSTTAATSSFFEAMTDAPPVPPRRTAPPFTLQQNTQAEELRVLEQNYPTAILRRNFQTSSILALHTERQNVRNAFTTVRRIKGMAHILQATPLKFREVFLEMLRGQFSNRERREIQAGTLHDMTSYRNAVEVLRNYRAERETFMLNKARYSTRQAEYNQRAAMIRQKPNIPKIVDTQQILETVSEWENVWGVSIKKGMEGHLFIRVGLCDIVMNESASESRYDYPAAIKLAPSLFTIKLGPDGNFLCRSDQNNCLGLSRGTQGTYGYEFHPHQLSDAPCFGTFSQTFVDLAIHGEIIALIGGIIAFYSQYNSQDSAGVNATLFHPAHLPTITDVGHYSGALLSHIQAWNYFTTKTDKLREACTRYTEYSAEERTKTPPERQTRNICYNCENENAGDGTEYCLDSHEHRICIGCWENSYCSGCEQHYEDCTCEDNDY